MSDPIGPKNPVPASTDSGGGEISIAVELVDVLLDSGVWVFALGASLIAALVAWSLSHRAEGRSVVFLSSLAGGVPVGLLVAAYLASTVRDGIDSQIAFLFDPANVFAHSIWFGFGCVAAYLVLRWRKRLIFRKRLGEFE